MLQAQASNDTTALTPELLDAQREIETRASKDGYDRYIKQQDSAVSNMGGHASAEAVKLIRGSIPVVSAKISGWIAENDHAGRGRRHAALAVLKRFDPDLLAFLTLNGIFSGITQEQQVVTIQTGIGAQIEAEIVSMDLEETQGRKVALRVKAQVAKNGSYHQRKRVLAKLSKEHLPEHVAWTQEYKVRVSEPLVNAALTVLSDMFELVTLPAKRNQRMTIIRLTDEGVQMLGQLRESMAWMPISTPPTSKLTLRDAPTPTSFPISFSSPSR